MMTPDERRAERRFSIDLPVRELGETWRLTRATEISTRGAFVPEMFAKELGDEVHLQIDTLLDAQPVSVMAQVVRLGERGVGCGLRFVESDGAIRELIHTLSLNSPAL